LLNHLRDNAPSRCRIPLAFYKTPHENSLKKSLKALHIATAFPDCHNLFDWVLLKAR
jgi:hypothetical protein